MVSRGYWLVAGSATTLQPRKPAQLLTLRATVAGCSYISKLFRVRARAYVYFHPATCNHSPETRANTGSQRFQPFFQGCNPAATSEATPAARAARGRDFAFQRKWLFLKDN